MKQQSLSQSARCTRRCEFLGEKERVVPYLSQDRRVRQDGGRLWTDGSRPEAQRQSDQDLANLFALLVQKWLSA